MTPFSQKMMCLSTLAGIATAGYTCSDGYTTKAGEPSCATAYEAGCSKATCCIAPKKCSAYSVTWILAQATNGGCHKNGNKAFFDKKKSAMTVAAPHKDADIKAACCTPYSSAKCSDWAGVHACASGTGLQKDKAAPPDGADGKSFTALAKFRATCCATTPKTCATWSVAWMAAATGSGYTCADGPKAGEPLCATANEASCSKTTCCNAPKTCATYSAAWILAQAVNGGCQKDSNKDFFDKKKMAVVVASPHGETQVKAACCTPFSAAKCSDWTGIYACAAGTSVQNDKTAAPDGADGKSFTALAKFRETCCATTPKTCATYSAAWMLASLTSGGCLKDGAKDFFDRKKMAVVVASPHGDAQVKAACCTPFSSAKCSDWAGIYGCASGTVLHSTDAAAPDGSDGKTFSALAKYRQACCKAPLKCSAYPRKGGCAKDNAKDFFDKKKMAVTVASPQGDTQVKAACCTPFLSAKCSDWAGVHGCVAGTSLQKDSAAAPDGTDGKSFSDVAKFRAKCCAIPPTPPKKCSAYTVAWILAQAVNGGCQKDSNKAFFDKKKLAMTVAAPHKDADIKAACCTPYSSAKCVDWAGVYGCAVGTVLLSTDAAAPDGSDGKTFSNLAKFRQVCCKAPLKCSAYIGTEMASGAIMQATSFWLAVVGVIAMWVL